MSQKNVTEEINSDFWKNNKNIQPSNHSHVMNVSYVESDYEIEERLGHIFKQLDRNGNGRIDIQELTTALKDSGMSHQYAEVNLNVTINQRKETKFCISICSNSFSWFLVCFLEISQGIR